MRIQTIQKNRNLLIAGLLAFAMLLFTQISVQAYEAWGGWSYGAKLIGGYQSLTIGNALLDSSLNIGQVPSVTTGTPTNAASTATLNGNVTHMGVASSTYTYFEWYQDGITHTTALQTKNAISTVTDDVTYDPNKDLTFRIVAQVGSVTTNGSWVTLHQLAGNTFFKIFMPIITSVGLALIILVVIFLTSGLTFEILMYTGIGAVLAYFVITYLINSWF